MAAEYRLSYTASEINEKLGTVDKNKENINTINQNVEEINENISGINEDIVGIREEVVSNLEESKQYTNNAVKAVEEVTNGKADADHTHPGQEKFMYSEPEGQVTGDYWMLSY